jgi:carboxyl-terminal processing protease
VLKISFAQLKYVTIPIVLCIFLVLTPLHTYAKETDKYTELNETIDLLKALHLSGVTEEELHQAAIEGMIDSLDDPYTEYLSKEQLVAFTKSLNQIYYGTGIILDEIDDEYYVKFVLEHSSAEEMGIQEGDVIISLNGKNVEGKSLRELEQAEVGMNGQVVKLTVRRAGKVLAVSLTYKEVQFPLVTSRWFGDGVGYIQLHTFSDEAATQFIDELDKLTAKGLKSLLIDLRYNGGGLLSATETIAEKFLDHDVLMYTKDNKGKEAKVEVKGQSPLTIPIIILVNEGTASASEVFAGALQDNQLALVVGDQSYGKGVIQQVIPLYTSGAALKMTVNEYFTPNRHKVDGVGITPDIAVSGIPEQLLRALYAAGSKKLNIVIKPTTININGEILRTQVDDIKQDGKDYMPLRFLAAAVGAELAWDSASNSIIVTNGTKKVVYPKKSIMISNNFSYIDVKSFQKDFSELSWSTSSGSSTINVGI